MGDIMDLGEKKPTISTGQPSTLKTYRDIAFIMGGECKATEFIDEKIRTSKNGENEIVIADERQMLMLLTSLIKTNNK